MRIEDIHFGENVLTHRDQTIGTLEIWIPDEIEVSKKNEQWKRISIAPGVKPTAFNDINALPVGVRLCAEVRQKMIKSLSALLRLQSDDSDNLQFSIPDDNGGLSKKVAEQITNIGQRLLVWSNTPVTTAEEITSSFKNITSIEQFGDTWLVEADGNMLMKPLSQAQNEIEKVADDSISNISSLGSVVGDLNKVGAERLCICVKQNHGTPSEAEKMSDAQFQKWIAHQNEIVGILKILVETIGIDKIIFLPERKSDYQASKDQYALLLHNEQLFADAQRSLTASRNLHANLRKLISEMDAYTLYRNFGTYVGMDRFLCASDTELPNLDIHSLEYSGRRDLSVARANAEACGNTHTFKELHLEDMRKMHTNALNLVNDIPISDCGVILLGAGHFESGSTYEDITAKKYEDFDPRRIDHTFERYVAICDDVKNVRFIILQTANWDI
mgnify:FL=1